MKFRKPKNIKSLRKVFNNLCDIMEKYYDKDSQGHICADINDWLDELRNNDFFGTEGQNDPRGSLEEHLD